MMVCLDYLLPEKENYKVSYTENLTFKLSHQIYLSHVCPTDNQIIDQFINKLHKCSDLTI